MTDPTPIYTETAWLHGFAPMPRPLGSVNTPTLVRVAPPLVDVTRGPISRDMPSIRLLPLTGHQSPGEAW